MYMKRGHPRNALVKLTRGELPCIGKTYPVTNLNFLIDKLVCVDWSPRHWTAKNDKSDDDVFYSPPFYTSYTGYKMCLRAGTNGWGDDDGTHVSVSFEGRLLQRGYTISCNNHLKLYPYSYLSLSFFELGFFFFFFYLETQWIQLLLVESDWRVYSWDIIMVSPPSVCRLYSWHHIPFKATKIFGNSES